MINTYAKVAIDELRINTYAKVAIDELRFLCDKMTAFCGPVVPLEHMTRATSCDLTSNSRNDGNVGRSSSVDIPPSRRTHPGGQSDPITKIFYNSQY